MSFDALTNHGEYLSAHYLAEVLPGSLKKGLLTEWAAAEKAGDTTPRQGLRALRQIYFAFKSELVDLADEDKRGDKLRELHDEILTAFGFTPSRLDGPGLSVVQAGWADDTDEITDADGAGRLLDPVELDPRHTITTGFALASHLFTGDEPPRYVLILNGGVVTLADRHTWGEGRYLAVSLDTAFGRNDTRNAGEIDVIAALFGADSLLPPPEGGDSRLSTMVGESRQHAVGVSGELREGLRLSVELIANEVLMRIREHGVDPARLMEPRELARELGRESLRYLYRILFLLYAESRPELGVLPVDDREYVEGYSVQRLGDLVSRKLGGEQARQSFHLYESLDLLFRMVNEGHHAREDAPIVAGASEGVGIRFEALKSDLFLHSKTPCIGRDAFKHPDDDDETSPRTIDTRLRNRTMYQVLRLLMLTRGRRKERGGFISYAQLGINQLGAVYEGLMSYSGFIATEELYEVAKDGEPKDGSWMIPASKTDDYPDEVFVTRANEETGVRNRVRYPAGSFVYRLAGRDRQTSASYYTPQSLTEVTVQLALKYRLDQDGTTTRAREMLDWTICEPALGSGAFLNEAITQVAAEYLRRRQIELNARVDPDQYVTELLRVKAYIALHNCYGVDLNATAVELAEVSMWLNVMHRGLQAPWFGLHLRRGNSLIGARRQFYTPGQLADKSWLTTAPTDHPLRSVEPLPADAIHHFLLPADGWGAVAGEKEAKSLAAEDAKRLGDWRRHIKSKPDAKQGRRLRAVAMRVERLWDLVRQRLDLSEQEIRRDIAVWGADDLPPAKGAVQREQIKADLEAPGGPYWRLKTLMNAWCALWFWPLDKTSLLDGSDPVYDKAATVTHVAERQVVEELVTDEAYEAVALFDTGTEQLRLPLSGATRKVTRTKTSIVEQLDRAVPLADLDNWLDFAEGLVGRADVPADSLVERFTSLAGLDGFEEQLPQWTGMDPHYRLFERFRWLEVVREIAEEQGFFHWEVEFAQAFAKGGFDLQVGNPPWVRPRWQEDVVLAECEPWFALVEKPGADMWHHRKSVTLAGADAADYFLAELIANAGVVASLGSVSAYPLLAGTQPDLYRAFMCQTWTHLATNGTAGLIHPDTHFGGIKERTLRSRAYRHLRVHGGFINAGNWAFADASRDLEFGIHIYGSVSTIDFLHLSQLYGVSALVDSFTHNNDGPPPGQKYLGSWDRRPHASRMVRVDEALLTQWQKLRDDKDETPGSTPLLYPISTSEQAAVASIAAFRNRLNLYHPKISAGYHEGYSRVL